jgi:hypothetical protein
MPPKGRTAELGQSRCRLFRRPRFRCGLFDEKISRLTGATGIGRAQLTAFTGRVSKPALLTSQPVLQERNSDAQQTHDDNANSYLGLSPLPFLITPRLSLLGSSSNKVNPIKCNTLSGRVLFRVLSVQELSSDERKQIASDHLLLLSSPLSFRLDHSICRAGAAIGWAEEPAPSHGRPTRDAALPSPQALPEPPPIRAPAALPKP